MAAFNYNASNMSEVFQMLESNNVDIVNEIKQLIYEQYEEGKARFVYCHSGTSELKRYPIFSCQIQGSSQKNHWQLILNGIWDRGCVEMARGRVRRVRDGVGDDKFNYEMLG